jgi:hypothetical protein
MPIAGGVYTRSDGVRTGSTVNVTAAAAGVKCTAALADARENDFATAINACLLRDGSNAATDDLDLGSHKITLLADGVADTDAANKGQMDAAIAAMFSTFGASVALAANAAAARAILTPFESGTVMLFVQTSAPTGWTKSTTHNNKALRIVSGTASSGGSVDFTTAFASKAVAGTVGNTILTVAQIPGHDHGGSTSANGAHTHTMSGSWASDGTGGGTSAHIMRDDGYAGTYSDTSTIQSAGSHSHPISSQGSGQSHTHTFTGTAIDLAVSYIDVILATKD